MPENKTHILSNTSIFEMILLGDVQHYNEYSSPNLFEVQCSWIKKNLEKENIVFVTQVGDVTESGYYHQWQTAGTIVNILDGPGPLGIVPYSVTFGNHDIAMPGPFGASRYESYAYTNGGWYGGATSDDLCHYQIFRAGNYTFLHLNMVENPNYYHIQWAKGILEENSDKPTMISTHEYLILCNTGRNFIGEEIYSNLVNPYSQVFMVVCGHGMPARHETAITSDGRRVIEMMVNYQNTTHGGDAWLQKVKFDPVRQRIGFETYSPSVKTFLMDYSSDFAFEAEFTENRINIKKEILKNPILEFRGTRNRNWDNPTNWNGSVPTGGEMLWFSGDGNSTNTFPEGAQFDSLVLKAGAGSHHIYGNLLTLTKQILDINYIGNPTFVRKPSIFDPFFNGYGFNIHVPLKLENVVYVNTGLRMTSLLCPISGAGSIEVTGGGILMLGSSNSYQGGTVINGAEVIITNMNALGDGDVVINSGFLNMVLPANKTNLFSNNVCLPAFYDGSNPSYGDSQFWILNPSKPTTLKVIGHVSGGHPSLVFNMVDTAIDNNYNAVLTLANVSNDFKGVIKVNHGTLAIETDEALGNITNGIQVLSGQYKGGIRFDRDNVVINSNRNIYIGGWEVINVQSNFAKIECPINGSGNLLKEGTGTLHLSGVASYIGVTTVTNGTLEVNGLFNAGNAITVGSNGIIAGNGLIKRSLFVNGCLSPGIKSCDVLTVSNLVGLRGLTIMEISSSSSGATCDMLAGVSTLTLGGTLIVTNVGADELRLGDRFQLFKALRYTGDFANVILPPLPDHVYWDLANLNKSGTISVAAKPAITGLRLSGIQDGAAIFQFNVTNQIISSCTLLESTNLLSWNILATNLQSTNGIFQFYDPNVSKDLRHFYRLSAP